MSIYLRKATIEDAKDLLSWRNDPTTRENSFTKGEIDLETHMKWLQSKLLNEDHCLMLILMEDDLKLGHVRVDITNHIGEVSYMISPVFRGNGYGKKILKFMEKKLPMGVKTLVGFTVKENIASGKCFLANDYTEFAAGGVKCFIKELRK